MARTDPVLAPLSPRFYRRPPAEVARDLLGRYLVRTLPAGAAGAAAGDDLLVLRLIEVEAYQGEGDAASHASSGPVTPRSRRLFRDGGHAYVYLIYGMHHCVNAVTGSAGDGTAVLLRAGEPVAGAERMAALRGLLRPPRSGDLAGGPGKLCQAMGVDGGFDGAPLWEGELVITHGRPAAPGEIASGPRVGVAYAGEAADWPLRFAIRGNPHVSRPRL